MYICLYISYMVMISGRWDSGSEWSPRNLDVIQTVSIVLKDLELMRRVLREMQEQRIVYRLRSSAWQGHRRIGWSSTLLRFF